MTASSSSALTRLAVLFGGRSPEHEVSVVSARAVMAHADPARFEVVPFAIDRAGTWLTPEETRVHLARIEAGATGAIEAGETARGAPQTSGLLGRTEVLAALAETDVVFPIVHGTNGEDGTLQGLLELAGLPYVGAGVAASAVGMDKDLMRAVFAHAGIPQARWCTLRDEQLRDTTEERVRDLERTLGYPCFVKPANGGSSVGVSKARSREDLLEAIREAARFDRKVLVEEAIEGREVECAVLGNAHPEASPLGEIMPKQEFYTYDAKYADTSTEYAVPARVSKAVEEHIQELAIRAYLAIDCSGLARVDCFVTPSDEVRVIEVNTLPGFTPISMYPRLWQEAGLSYGELITRLVELAFERREALAGRGE